MGPQVTMQPELPVMNWLLSDLPSYKVGCAQQHYIIKRKQDIPDWPCTGPESTNNLHEEVAQIPMVPTCAKLPSLSQPVPMASWGAPYYQRKRRHEAGLQMALPHMQTPHNSPSLRHPWRTVVKGNPLSRQDCKQCTLWCTLWLCTDSRAMANSLAGSSGAWKKCDWKIDDKEIGGRGLWGDHSEWAKHVKIFVSHVNVRQRVISAEEDFYNQANRVTHSVIYQSAFSSSHSCEHPVHSWTKWLWWQGWGLPVGSAT